MKSVVKKDVIQNLRDAGCSEEAVAAISTEFASGNDKAAMKLIEKQRRELLDVVHEKEQCISRLDYLTYQITRNNFKPCTEV